MELDVLNIFFPDALKGMGLQGSHPSWVYLGQPDANGLRDLVCIKGKDVDPLIPGGYPWDWMTVGEDYFYQRLTELAWSKPNTGKLMFGKGSPRFQRYIDYSASQPPGTWDFTIGRPQTDYVIFDVDPKGGKYGVPTSRNTDAAVTNSISGPYAAVAVGDLPAGWDWCFNYVRNNGKVLERKTTRTVNQSAICYGPWRWQQFKLVNGQWVQDTDPNGKPYDSQNTKILNVPCPVPVQYIF